jgi:hypothetical protein
MNPPKTSPCPICNAPVPIPGPTPEAKGGAGRTYPFCSSRCRTIDLGNWLGERYAIPADVQENEPTAGRSEDMSDPSA